MNLDSYPTPESDACYLYCVKNYDRDTGPIMREKMRCLERRLVLARDTLRRVKNDLMRDEQRKMLIDWATKETDTPVVDS